MSDCFVTPWTVAFQAPLSMGFPRQEYWSGLPFPSPGYLSDPGVKPVSLMSPALAGRFFTTHTRWRSHNSWRWDCSTNRGGCSPLSWWILSGGSSNAGSGSSGYNTSSLWGHDLLGRLHRPHGQGLLIQQESGELEHQLEHLCQQLYQPPASPVNGT